MQLKVRKNVLSKNTTKMKIANKTYIPFFKQENTLPMYVIVILLKKIYCKQNYQPSEKTYKELPNIFLKV